MQKLQLLILSARLEKLFFRPFQLFVIEKLGQKVCGKQHFIPRIDKSVFTHTASRADKVYYAHYHAVLHARKIRILFIIVFEIARYTVTHFLRCLVAPAFREKTVYARLYIAAAVSPRIHTVFHQFASLIEFLRILFLILSVKDETADIPLIHRLIYRVLHAVADVIAGYGNYAHFEYVLQKMSHAVYFITKLSARSFVKCGRDKYIYISCLYLIFLIVFIECPNKSALRTLFPAFYRLQCHRGLSAVFAYHVAQSALYLVKFPIFEKLRIALARLSYLF